MSVTEFLDDVTHPVRRRCKDAIYWFKYRIQPRHKYHIVRTGLPPGYYDEDTRILHACMTALCEYVEQGCDGEAELEKFNADLRDPSSHVHGTEELNLEQAKQQEEALAIYRWWKYQKPADEKRQDDALTEWHDNRDKPGTQERWEAMNEIEAKVAADEQAMLHRLIEIRPTLWT